MTVADRIAVWAVWALLSLALAPSIFAYPHNVGFRGGTAEAPENTLATYDNTLNGGGEWLEMDVWVSADGVPVCHHDETVDRTTDGTGIIWQKTLAELKALDAGSWFDPAFAGEQIPTLAEALTLVKGRGKVLLDIRDSDYIDEIAQVVADVEFPSEDIYGWIRFGGGMMSNYKTLFPDSEGFFGTLGPFFVTEEDIWGRTQADDRPDLGLIAAYEHVEGRADWIELVHSYGMAVFVLDCEHTSWSIRRFGRSMWTPERASGDLLPRAHSVFGNLKAWLRGTFHDVSPKYLQRYLDEFVLRFDRGWKETELFIRTLNRFIEAPPCPILTAERIG